MSWGCATHAVLALCRAPRLICSRGKGMPLLRGGMQQGCALCSSLHTPSLARAQPRAPVTAGRPAGSWLLLERGKIKACPATVPRNLCVCRD